MAVADDVPVVATWEGEVSFAGEVAGRLYVTERLASGALVTYGGLVSIDPGVTEGTVVARGDPVGVATGHLFLSVRLGGRYVEPLTALGLARPRLVDPSGIAPSDPAVGPDPASR